MVLRTTIVGDGCTLLLRSLKEFFVLTQQQKQSSRIDCESGGGLLGVLVTTRLTNSVALKLLLPVICSMYAEKYPADTLFTIRSAVMSRQTGCQLKK